MEGQAAQAGSLLSGLRMPLTGLPATTKTPSGAQGSPASTYLRSSAFPPQLGLAASLTEVLEEARVCGWRVARGRVSHTEN